MGVLAAVVAFIYYYVTLPAINIHSSGFWFFIMAAIVVVIVLYVIRKAGKDMAGSGTVALKLSLKEYKPFEVDGDSAAADIGCIYYRKHIVVTHHKCKKKYQQLLALENRNFTDDIKEVDYRTIPLLDKDSAALLGDRKMGSLVDIVSQFEVADDYTQLNYNGVPVRVTPLVYASPVKWLTNQKKWYSGVYPH